MFVPAVVSLSCIHFADDHYFFCSKVQSVVIVAKEERYND